MNAFHLGQRGWLRQQNPGTSPPPRYLPTNPGRKPQKAYIIYNKHFSITKRSISILPGVKRSELICTPATLFGRKCRIGEKDHPFCHSFAPIRHIFHGRKSEKLSKDRVNDKRDGKTVLEHFGRVGDFIEMLLYGGNFWVVDVRLACTHGIRGGNT